jgi:hypothetical protein
MNGLRYLNWPSILLLGEDERVRSIGVALYTESQTLMRLYDDRLVSGNIHQVRLFLAFDPISYFAFASCLTEGMPHDGGYNDALFRTSFKKIMVSRVYVGGALRWLVWSDHHAASRDERRALAIN